MGNCANHAERQFKYYVPAYLLAVSMYAYICLGLYLYIESITFFSS